MTQEQAVILRGKMIGAMMREARVASGKSLKEVAEKLFISPATLSSYEYGRKSISLPELERFAFELDISLEAFLTRDPGARHAFIASDPEKTRIQRDLEIGEAVRQRREKLELTIKALADRIGAPPKRLSGYERGDRSIPLAELELIADALACETSDFLDTHSEIADWLATRSLTERLSEIPADLAHFIADPENMRYLKLAQKISAIPEDDLRALARGLAELAP